MKTGMCIKQILLQNIYKFLKLISAFNLNQLGYQNFGQTNEKGTANNCLGSTFEFFKKSITNFETSN